MENKNLNRGKDKMEPMVSVMKTVEEMGFITQFRVTENGLLSLATQKIFQPTEVKVAHFYRFEGQSNQDDNAILYAIETKTGEKGTLVDAYGPSSDPLISDFMLKVEGIHK